MAESTHLVRSLQHISYTKCSSFKIYLSIYLSSLVTAVAIFRNPNTIPFCLTTDLLQNSINKYLFCNYKGSTSCKYHFYPVARLLEVLYWQLTCKNSGM
jgi:hypothetical protein